jgi:CubicO group peptidase (beta-lactamase class C family)
VLVARKGNVLYRRASGVADRERNVPMTLDTKIQIASTTKLFTQIAIRQLEQAGKLSLADTVGKFLPTYPNATVRSKVTVEQLLRHRSGIGSFWNERFMARRAEIRTVNDYLELFQTDPLLFEPGTGEMYSNGGYVLLGAIIERVSGKSYHDYLRERIFRPAGMTQTMPFDRQSPTTNAAIGYTFQNLDGPLPGDRRLAGPSTARPGYETRTDSQTVRRAPADTGMSAGDGRRLRIVGADGRALSPEEAREAMARRATAGGTRRPNSNYQPGVSSPAGDHYSTVEDFLKLANALTSYRLLDSTRTAALFGARYASGTDFRANGGGPGVNAEFSIFPTGEVVVVLSNYDPPSATAVAQFIRALVSPSPQASLRSEVDALHAAMIAAFKRDPASVARFYTDDAQIIGMGMHRSGREQVNAYWGQRQASLPHRPLYFRGGAAAVGGFSAGFAGSTLIALSAVWSPVSSDLPGGCAFN